VVHFWIPYLQTAKASENGPKPKKERIVFQPSIFRDYVSFREGIPPVPVKIVEINSVPLIKIQ